jgi:hypothetical protein
MFNRFETLIFSVVYTMAAIVIALDLLYWRP